jgi:hypothetical protein
MHLRVPKACQSCGGPAVKLEQTVKGDFVTLAWTCAHCGYASPVAATDEERRVGPAERRQSYRGDRRQTRTEFGASSV